MPPHCGIGNNMAKNSAGFILESPYTASPHRHKVQLHAHTNLSDGDHDPQRVMQAYAERGYAAAAITDHDYRGRTSPTLEDPGGHSIVHVPGVEYSASATNRSWRHLLAVAVSSIHHADGLDDRQSQINRAASENAFSFLCHPYGDDVHVRGWPDHALLNAKGYSGIEIYNGASCGAPEKLACFPRAVDLALLSGRRIHVIATDDYHRHIDRGYIVIHSTVPAERLILDDVLLALRRGDFFSVGRTDPHSPQGPHFLNIEVAGQTVAAATDVPADIEFITARGNYAGAGPRCSLRETDTCRAQYAVNRDDRFVRIEATVRKDGLESRAWSNPIFVRQNAE